MGTCVRATAREELEQLRRSIAMLQPGSLAMRREDAMGLLGDLGEVQGRLDLLRDGLRALLNEDAVDSAAEGHPMLIA